MQALGPITQLYISIDAATKEKLKQIDLPLFKDYWERYLKCMEVIKNKKQRTVYRLTLILGENMDEIDEYVKLVKIGEPELIEIKGVTFSGDSDKISMKSVPRH